MLEHGGATLTSHPSPVGYFDDLSAVIERSEADPEVLTDIAVKYSVEVIGPVPEGYL